MSNAKVRHRRRRRCQSVERASRAMVINYVKNLIRESFKDPFTPPNYIESLRELLALMMDPRNKPVRVGPL